jgi:hypothetical protein
MPVIKFARSGQLGRDIDRGGSRSAGADATIPGNLNHGNPQDPVLVTTRAMPRVVGGRLATIK